MGKNKRGFRGVVVEEVLSEKMRFLVKFFQRIWGFRLNSFQENDSSNQPRKIRGSDVSGRGNSKYGNQMRGVCFILRGGHDQIRKVWRGRRHSEEEKRGKGKGEWEKEGSEKIEERGVWQELSSHALCDSEGSWEVWGRESCILQRQPCGGHPHHQSWLEAGILGRGRGNHRPAPEKLAHLLSWKPGVLTGQGFGLPSRSSRHLKVQRQWGPSGSAKQRSPALPPGNLRPDACSMHKLPRWFWVCKLNKSPFL